MIWKIGCVLRNCSAGNWPKARHRQRSSKRNATAARTIPITRWPGMNAVPRVVRRFVGKARQAALLPDTGRRESSAEKTRRRDFTIGIRKAKRISIVSAFRLVLLQNSQVPQVLSRGLRISEAMQGGIMRAKCNSPMGQVLQAASAFSDEVVQTCVFTELNRPETSGMENAGHYIA